MADSLNNTIPVLSVCATIGEKVKDLPIQNGQLIFVQDKHRIAFDFNDKRRFYNQIEELETEQERLSLLAPVSGTYYFIIETAVLWVYKTEWVQITTKPDEILFIGTEMPELGQARTLYVDRTNKEISVWDDVSESYEKVSNYTGVMTREDILGLF